MKHGPGLERQLVIGNMGGFQCTRGPNILERLLQRLLRQGVHQIEIEIVELRRAQFGHGAVRIVRRVNAAQYFERARRKGLRAQRHSIDAGIPVALRNQAALDRARIGFQQSDFRIIGERNPLPQNAPSRRLKSSGWNKLGVPPPKNTVSILRPRRRASSKSKSRISASMYAAVGRGSTLAGAN